MISKLSGSLALVLALVAGQAVLAQDQVSKVADNGDWTGFEYPPICTADVTTGCRQSGAAPEDCFAASAPVSTEYFRSGQSVQATTDPAELLVLYRPAANIAGQVSYTGGYPFAEGSKVQLKIGSDTFELFTDGTWAWAMNAEQDAAIVAAMRRGADGTLTGTSSRGTTVVHKISLAGFTATVEEANRRCGG